MRAAPRSSLGPLRQRRGQAAAKFFTRESYVSSMNADGSETWGELHRNAAPFRFLYDAPTVFNNISPNFTRSFACFVRPTPVCHIPRLSDLRRRRRRAPANPAYQYWSCISSVQPLAPAIGLLSIFFSLFTLIDTFSPFCGFWLWLGFWTLRRLFLTVLWLEYWFSRFVCLFINCHVSNWRWIEINVCFFLSARIFEKLYLLL